MSIYVHSAGVWCIKTFSKTQDCCIKREVSQWQLELGLVYMYTGPVLLPKLSCMSQLTSVLQSLLHWLIGSGAGAAKGPDQDMAVLHVELDKVWRRPLRALTTLR